MLNFTSKHTLLMNPNTEPLLRSKKINPTAMRILVLDYLLSKKNATTLTDIEKALAPADRITIYRTIKTFEQQGLVHHIDDGTGAIKYALCADDCTSGEHHDIHVHFLCNSCKETFCLPKTKVPTVNLPSEFKPEEISLLVKGICQNCSV